MSGVYPKHGGRSDHASAPVIFKPLRPTDRALYEHYYYQGPHDISDLCFNSRMAWTVAFHYHYALLEDTLVVVAQRSVWTGLHFSFPLGIQSCEQFARIADALWQPYAELTAVLTGEDPHLRFLYVPEAALPCLSALPGYEVRITHDPAYSDYVYRGEALRTLEGKALRNKRGHLQQFLRAYPDAQFAPFTLEDAEEALQLTASWCEAKGLAPDDIGQSDYLALESLLSKAADLALYGGTIRIGGRLIAFSLYSLAETAKGSSAYCHFEKAALGYEAAYTAITHWSVCACFPEVEWVNREEDMGLPGLRKAKQSYHPDHLLDKYEVVLRKLP